MSDIASSAPASRRAGGFSGWIATQAGILLTATVTIALALKFLLVFRININWDEFYYLSFVQDYLRGTVSDRFQTLHVHFFAWLPMAAAKDEIGQILLARLVMAGCASASALLLYGIARRFLSRDGALFGLLGYLATTAVIEHGTSFRTDSIATVLVLLALFLILRRPGGAVGAAVAGLAMAVAAMITIKTAFYVAVMAPLIWFLGRDLRDRARLALAFGACLVLAFAAIYWLHVSTLAPPGPSNATHYLQGAASKVFFEDGLFPRWAELLINLAQNPLFWLLTLQGVWVARQAVRADETGSRRDRWLLLLLALPILTPLFYRNAFAYYYAFILPPAAVLIGMAYERYRRQALESNEPRPFRLLALLLCLQCGVFLYQSGRNLPDAIEPQRATLDAVHAVFPEPVPYIDGYGVVASFPRTGFFMSSWGLGKYREAGVPVFRDLVAKAQPPLLLADSPSLYAALVPGVTVVPERELLNADIAFLRDNYLQHWGMVFVAGKTIELPALGEKVAFDVAIAGDYRLESAIPVHIDGKELAPEGVVTLAAGTHSILADRATGPATLRWAGALPAPDTAPTDIWAFFSAGN